MKSEISPSLEIIFFEKKKIEMLLFQEQKTSVQQFYSYNNRQNF